MILPDMTLEGFEKFTAELVHRGHPAESAALMGDVIETDKKGKWIVRNESGKIIDRIDPLADEE